MAVIRHLAFRLASAQIRRKLFRTTKLMPRLYSSDIQFPPSYQSNYTPTGKQAQPQSVWLQIETMEDPTLTRFIKGFSHQHPKIQPVVLDLSGSGN
jgi:hypothetical protein